MRGSDKRLRCDSWTQEIWDAIEEMNALITRRTKAENEMISYRGRLSRLRDNLRAKQAALLTAQVASNLGVPGKVVGGSAVFVLEREIRQVEQDISSVERDMARAEKIIGDAKDEISNLKGLIEQLRADKRDLGCDR